MKNINSILSDFKTNKEKTDLAYTIGVVTLIVYSKEAFKKNKDIEPFLEKVFNKSFLPYVFRSRTIICAKLGRELTKLNESDLKSVNINLLNYFEINKKNNAHGKTQEQKKKRNANDKLDTWLKGF